MRYDSQEQQPGAHTHVELFFSSDSQDFADQHPASAAEIKLTMAQLKIAQGIQCPPLLGSVCT